MTTVIVLADPPVKGVACERLVEQTELTPSDGLALYEAVVADTMATLERSTVDILVNYPQADAVPGDSEAVDPKARLRELTANAMTPDRFEDVRFEPQVGSNFSAKAGNAITHLIREEDAQSAAVLDPCVPRLARSIVDEGALKLRRADVVLGPAARGEVYFAGFSELIDFTDVFETRPIEAVTREATANDLAVDFLRMREGLSNPAELRGVLTRLKANTLAGKPLPEQFWQILQEREIELRDGEITSAAAEATDSS